MKKVLYCAIFLFCLMVLFGCAKEKTLEVYIKPAITEATEQTPSANHSETSSPAANPIPTVSIASTPEPTPLPIASPSPSPKPTPIPTASPSPSPVRDEYYIDGLRIFRRSGGEDFLVYVVTPYFPSGWNCYLSKLMVNEGNVYFTEGGMPGDDYAESLHRIICIDRLGRTVLYESDVCGYDQIMAYGDKIFFVIGEFDSAQIGWAKKDASDGGLLNFVDYAACYGIESFYNSTELYVKDGILYANIDFYTGQYWPDEMALHTVQIGEDLSIKRIDDT